MPADNILGQILIQGFGGLLANMTSAYANRKVREISVGSDVIKRDLEEHLNNTFNKCMKVKTILNSEETANTLEIYVDQSFKLEDKAIDQYSLVEFIRTGNSVIIIGEGGGGKSMFMRYLWLSYFEKSDGKIPFFLELRNLNALSHSNISDFIFYSIIKSGSTIPQSEFKSALRAGEFILFLDGFDEVNFDKRDWVQERILELQENNPDLTIVVTSRSDERFMGWDSFRQVKVCALTKKLSKMLIERANCNEDLKRKFLVKFPDLYANHEGFLSNPLLAYMMLVTFSYNPDIPNKMFQFYEQAFEALYHRHDLTKGYKRKFHSSLAKYDFIRLTSYLCLKTYYDEEVEFSRVDLISAVEAVKEIETFSVDTEAFIDDLVQSVCILKMEGLFFTFTHRSFQEYFAAYCIARTASRNLDTLFSEFSKRHSDKVLPMVADINPDLFREKYLIPNYKKYKTFIDRKSERHLVTSFASRIGVKFEIRNLPLFETSPKQSFDFGITLKKSGDMANFFNSAWSLIDGQGYINERISAVEDRHFVKVVKSLSPFDTINLLIEFHSNRMIFTFLDRNDDKPHKKKQSIIASDEVHKSLTKAFQKSRMNLFLKIRAQEMIKYVKCEVHKHDQVTGSFSDLF